MKKIRIKAICLFVLIIQATGLRAQYLEPSDTNFYDIRDAFYQGFMGNVTDSLEGAYFNHFRKWEKFWEDRVSPDGSFKQVAQAVKSYVDNYSPSAQSSIADWQELGPTINPGLGIGRISAIAFDPGFDNNTNKVMYVGSPSGGVWKSLDGGDNWSNLNTDLQFARLSVGCIAVDPGFNNTTNKFIYVGTGDYDGTFAFSDGIYRTSDGGVTWNLINSGLFGNVAGFYQIGKILVDPNNTTTMYAATSIGIFKCTNRQAVTPTWTKIYPASGNEIVRNIVFDPFNSQVLYASGITVVKSTNGGTSWASIATSTSGLNLSGGPWNTPAFPNEYIVRINIEISPANNFIYANIVTAPHQPPFFWNTPRTRRFCKYDINANSWTINNITGQLYLDDENREAIAVHSNNSNIVCSGGAYFGKSTNGGSSFSISIIGHADITALSFLPPAANDPNKMYVANDGGLWLYDIVSTVALEKNFGLGIATMYNTSSSTTDPNLALTGQQDCGNTLYDANSITQWKYRNGGDGFEQMIDYSDANFMYTTTYNLGVNNNGQLFRSVNGKTNADFIDLINNKTQNSIFGAPLAIDPKNPEILYQGRYDVWKTTSARTALPNDWVKISNLASAAQGAFTLPIKSLAVAPSNSNYIYATIAGNGVVRTTIGGGVNAGDWVVISPSTCVHCPNISSITVSALDPNTAWVTYSGYAPGTKVFKTTNGGSSWVNDDPNQSLPNLPVNCIVYERGSNDGVYVGTDVGVFFKNATMTNWVPFNTSLPNVIVNWLEINYSTNKIRAATYGRGLWESSLFCPTPTLVLSGQSNINGFQEASSSITASNSTIDPNARVNFRAGDFIELTPATNGQFFSAVPTNGSYFYMIIHRCNAAGNSPSFRSGGNSNASSESEKLPDIASDKGVEDNVSVYPNPNSGKFNLVSPDRINEITIYNVLGQVAFRGNFSGEQRSFEIDLTDKPKGVYFIRIEDANGNAKSKKILYQ